MSIFPNKSSETENKVAGKSKFENKNRITINPNFFYRVQLKRQRNVFNLSEQSTYIKSTFVIKYLLRWIVVELFSSLKHILSGPVSYSSETMICVFFFLLLLLIEGRKKFHSAASDSEKQQVLRV